MINVCPLLRRRGQLRTLTASSLRFSSMKMSARVDSRCGESTSRDLRSTQNSLISGWAVYESLTMLRQKRWVWSKFQDSISSKSKNRIHKPAEVVPSTLVVRGLLNLVHSVPKAKAEMSSLS